MAYHKHEDGNTSFDESDDFLDWFDDEILYRKKSLWEHIEIFFTVKWMWITNTKYEIKMWLQNAFRGYADVDVWSYYSRNSERAIKILTEMKKDKHGIPMQCIPNNMIGEDGNPTKEGMEQGEKNWNEVLDSIVFFNTVAAEKDRPKDRPFHHNPPQIRKRTGEEIVVTHYDPYYLYDDEKALFELGKKNFMEHYFSLWT